MKKKLWSHRMTELQFENLTAFVIILNVVYLTLECYFNIDGTVSFIQFLPDYFFLCFFIYEIFVVRARKLVKKRIAITLALRMALRGELSLSEQTKLCSSLGVMEGDEAAINSELARLKTEIAWTLFDALITIISAYGAIVLSVKNVHPESFAILRLFRVTRVLRLFEVHKSLINTERKIMSAIPTVFMFGVLLLIIHFTYAIIGINVYGHVNIGPINFSDIYHGVRTLFIALTNDWVTTYDELRLIKNVPEWVTDVYMISFFVVSAMIMLNVFLAILTNQIHDKVTNRDQQIDELHSNYDAPYS